jgi:hypothetical protein
MPRLNRFDNGTSIYRDAATGRVLSIIGTFRCVHCQMHVDAEPEVIRTRGFCQNCNGPVCGKPTCNICVHWEQRLENEEANRDELWKPITATVPASFDLIIPPELICAADNSQSRVPYDPQDRNDVGASCDPQRGDNVSGSESEALAGSVAAEPAN